MSKEIAKQQKCLLLKNGIEYWFDMDRVAQLEAILNPPDNRDVSEFIRLPDGDLISKNMIAGLYKPESMEEMTRKKLGQWRCEEGEWHTRNEQNCDCKQRRLKKEEQERQDAETKDITPAQAKRNKKAINKLRDSLPFLNK